MLCVVDSVVVCGCVCPFRRTAFRRFASAGLPKLSLLSGGGPKGGGPKMSQKSFPLPPQIAALWGSPRGLVAAVQGHGPPTMFGFLWGRHVRPSKQKKNWTKCFVPRRLSPALRPFQRPPTQAGISEGHKDEWEMEGERPKKKHNVTWCENTEKMEGQTRPECHEGQNQTFTSTTFFQPQHIFIQNHFHPPGSLCSASMVHLPCGLKKFEISKTQKSATYFWPQGSGQFRTPPTLPADKKNDNERKTKKRPTQNRQHRTMKRRQKNEKQKEPKKNTANMKGKTGGQNCVVLCCAWCDALFPGPPPLPSLSRRNCRFLFSRRSSRGSVA